MSNLLIVDDEEGLLEALTIILSDEGYQVEAVTSGQAALKALDASEEHLPDLIVADIVMPEMSGIELCETIRRSPDLADIPFLFISAFVSNTVEDQIAGQSKVAILRKPFEVEDLIEAVHSMCNPGP
ncbi:MAG: response regulator [Anaerolineae bacterium]|nr:response regulator [Anaerolineae bacterium]